MRRHLTIALATGILFSVTLLAENWPQWRGPAGNGVSPETGLPATFSSDRGILWKAPILGMGVSSPIVWEDQIFLTAQLGRGKLRPGNHPTLSREAGVTEGSLEAEDAGQAGTQFLIHSIDRESGETRWTFELPATGDFPEVHRKSNMATPSCVTDGRGVFCWFATGQLVAVDTDGQKIWEKAMGASYSPFQISWGHASSPTLYRDKIILLCDHRAASYLVALDTRSGDEIWRADRGSGLSSYSTPMIVPGPERVELLVNSSRGLDAYDPETGEHLWFLEQPNRFPVPSASFGDGTIFTSRGHRSGPYMAIEPGGSGNISGSHLKWQVETGAPYVTSVVYYRGLMYMVNGSGIVTAVDGDSGETLWKSRLGGVYSASPVAGDGKVYLTSEEGKVTVLQAGKEARVLGSSTLDERTLASPAISGGRLYFRTDRHLYSIGN